MAPEMDRSGDNPATLDLAGDVRAMLGEFAMGGGPFPAEATSTLAWVACAHEGLRPRIVRTQ
jgi:hypothetical protein